MRSGYGHVSGSSCARIACGQSISVTASTTCHRRKKLLFIFNQIFYERFLFGAAYCPFEHIYPYRAAKRQCPKGLCDTPGQKKWGNLLFLWQFCYLCRTMRV